MSDVGIPYKVLEMVRGDSAEFDFAVYDPVTGDPIDLNSPGVVAKMTAVQDYGGASVFVVDMGNGITFDVGPGGTGHVTVPKTGTEALPNERTQLPFDLQIEVPPDKRWTVVRGHIDLFPDVST